MTKQEAVRPLATVEFRDSYECAVKIPVPWPLEYRKSTELVFHDSALKCSLFEKGPKVTAVIRVWVEPGIESIMRNKIGADWVLYVSLSNHSGIVLREWYLELAGQALTQDAPPKEYIALLQVAICEMKKKIRKPLFVREEGSR